MDNFELSDDEKEAIYSLVETLIKQLEEDSVREADPFEQYTKKVKLHLFQQMKKSPEKFIKGHQAIFSVLDQC